MNIKDTEIISNILLLYRIIKAFYMALTLKKIFCSTSKINNILNTYYNFKKHTNIRYQYFF